MGEGEEPEKPHVRVPLQPVECVRRVEGGEEGEGEESARVWGERALPRGAELVLPAALSGGRGG